MWFSNVQTMRPFKLLLSRLGLVGPETGVECFLGFGSTTFGAFLGCWYMDTIVRGALFGFLEVF